MKTKLLLLIMLAFPIQLINAQQWEYYKDFPVNTYPEDVDINNAGTLFMVTRDMKIFYKLLDQPWQEMPKTQLNFPMNPLCISAHKSSNSIYVGTSGQGMHFTSNFGQTWNYTRITTSPISGFSESITTLSNVENNNLFFGTVAVLIPTISRYSNGGTFGEFLVYAESMDKAPRSLYYTQNGTLLIGTENAGIFMTDDNGSTFVQTNQSQYRILKFTEATEGTVYALGKNLSDDQYILLQSQNYTNWQTMELPENEDIFSSIFFNQAEQKLYLASDKGLYATSTAGTSWSDESFDNGQHAVLDIIADPNGNFYNFSVNYIAQKKEGGDWNSITTGLTGQLSSVIFGDEGKLFAGNIVSPIISSSTSSQQWSNYLVDASIVGVRGIYTRPNQKVFVCSEKHIFKSTDNGLNYTDITPGDIPEGLINRFFVGEQGDLFYTMSNQVVANNIYWSQDEGTTWSLFASIPSFFDFFEDTVESIAQDNTGTIYVTMNSLGNNAENGMTVHYTINNGQSWQQINYFGQEASSTGSITVSAKNNIVWTNIGKSLFLLDIANPGAEFIPINLPPAIETDPNLYPQLTIANNGDYYVFCSDLYHSQNQGEIWTNLGKPSGLNNTNMTVMVDFNNNPYLLLSDSYADPELKGIYYINVYMDILEYDVNKIKISLYPNPVTSELNINSTETIGRVDIFDYSGRKVLSLQQPFVEKVDVSHLSKGVYLALVKTISGAGYTLKFIKK